MVKYICDVLPLSSGITDFNLLSSRWDTFIEDK